jgi:glycine cleavage system regulatory protein
VVEIHSITNAILLSGGQFFLGNGLPESQAQPKRWFMQVSLVMTVIGKDRHGLVDSLAGIVADRGGNWLESRMSRLGGQFAGILRVEIPAEKEAALLRDLKQLETEGLTIVVQSDRPQAEESDQALTCLEILGQDRPGIIHQISHALAAHRVNVEELHTECSSAAMSGETLFKAEAKLKIPSSCRLSELKHELEQIAEDLIVDVTLKEMTRHPPAISTSTQGQTA